MTIRFFYDVKYLALHPQLLDYKALFLEAEEEIRLIEEKIKQEKEKRKQAEEERNQEKERNQPSTFGEFIGYSHDLLWRLLKAEVPSRSTTGTIGPPTDKYCPIRLLPWTACAATQLEIYESVCRYLQPTEADARQLFALRAGLEEIGRVIASQPISNERNLGLCERLAVEGHVRVIIAELCKIPDAREELQLGSGVWFANHPNALDENDEIDASEASSTRRLWPDQFCVRRVDSNTSTLLTIAEYKPPHKPTVQSLQIVEPDTTPAEEPEKSKYNTARLVGAAIVEEFHVMVQEGLEYSYSTNGLMDVQFWVPFDDPGTLHYDLGDPRIDRTASVGRLEIPTTRLSRALCLCLMSFRSSCRNHAWRENARHKLPIRHSSFDSERSQISITVSHQSAQDMECASSGHYDLEQATPELLPSSSSAGSPVLKGHRMATRPGLGCAPSSDQPHQEDSLDSDAASNTSTRHKQGLSKASTSPPPHQYSFQTNMRNDQSRQNYQHIAKSCTQKCLLGLQQGEAIDPCCPNAELHISGRQDDRHPIDVKTLVQMVTEQLDGVLDHNFTPMGDRGSYAAPFKVTCAAYGYTIVGKATTSRRWKVVSSEADVYRILRPVQGSAIPIFLGAINLDRNAELNRALIIDFHRCTLRQQPMHRRPGSNKRLRDAAQERDHKRVREV
ncbi:uncharacterized protein BDW70DRAFT_165750 [Aspergillus foveolatus]|uniref:uncharacterized protein n=1 Tax=Aspergillus foveolatus TaxID=210207 RepID=UPI003CCD9B24